MSVELIGDGRHIPRETMLAVLKIKGADRVALVTDAMRAAGTDASESYLGAPLPENRVIIEDGVAKLPDRSFYAGSIATSDRMFRVAVAEYGIPTETAVKMMCTTPAEIAGMSDRKGSLQIGKDADLVLLDESLNVTQVYAMGKPIL
jgi:N-acetylglucosamine-6-phosphate deacetylase